MKVFVVTDKELKEKKLENINHSNAIFWVFSVTEN